MDDWYDLVTRLIEIIPAGEIRGMGEIVRKANAGVRRHSIRATVLINIASRKEGRKRLPRFAERNPGQSGSDMEQTDKS